MIARDKCWKAYDIKNHQKTQWLSFLIFRTTTGHVPGESGAKELGPLLSHEREAAGSKRIQADVLILITPNAGIHCLKV
jgi:hypothetical protein